MFIAPENVSKYLNVFLNDYKKQAETAVEIKLISFACKSQQHLMLGLVFGDLSAFIQ